jgi:arsenate reductase
VIPGTKTRVLFVCVGNACRSQMAEGFSRTYGSDVMIAASVGLVPATTVAPGTVRAMEEKNIDLRDHFPKSLRQLGKAEFDLVVNMTGFFLPKEFKGRIVDWEVADPIFMDHADHCEVRDRIEGLVMKLVLELRATPRTQFRGQGSGRLEL